MSQYVDISFDCLPLRSVTRFDIPIDASPKFRARCERILDALAKHGAHNSYYLNNASCTFHLANSDEEGMIQFQFEGTVLTDAADQHTTTADLTVELVRETCDWLTQPVVEWFAQTVQHAVRIEFDRYIAAGDLRRTIERAERLERESDQQGGYLGMYL